ncbi:hypothetical protein Q1695_009526 [Nippostrongylus brasiliensis]|nr:hypothetical protein Q1695_009526 [Nippostrongylus brasiliensis]
MDRMELDSGPNSEEEVVTAQESKGGSSTETVSPFCEGDANEKFRLSDELLPDDHYDDGKCEWLFGAGDFAQLPFGHESDSDEMDDGFGCTSRNRRAQKYQKDEDDESPCFKTTWNIDPETPARNFRLLTSEVVSTPAKDLKSVKIPVDLLPFITDLHTPKPEDTRKIVEKLSQAAPRRHVFGSFFRINPDAWTVFWPPENVPQLTTLIVQSYICAALNCRRLLSFVLGVASDSVVVGCEWSEETRETMRRQFEFCINREFVPTLDEGLVSFQFYPVYDKDGQHMQSLYIAEICVKDKVNEVYQLSSGRFYYVNYKTVMQTCSFAEILKRFRNHKQKQVDVFRNPTVCIRCAPSLGSPVDDSIWGWFISRVLFFGVPGFLVALFAYNHFPHLRKSLGH